MHSSLLTLFTFSISFLPTFLSLCFFSVHLLCALCASDFSICFSPLPLLSLHVFLSSSAGPLKGLGSQVVVSCCNWFTVWSKRLGVWGGLLHEWCHLWCCSPSCPALIHTDRHTTWSLNVTHNITSLSLWIGDALHLHILCCSYCGQKDLWQTHRLISIPVLHQLTASINIKMFILTPALHNWLYWHARCDQGEVEVVERRHYQLLQRKRLQGCVYLHYSSPEFCYLATDCI